MNIFLEQTFNRLISELNVNYRRFLHQHFDLKPRLIGIIGPRGVGKTTFLLQYLKDHLYKSGKAFYCSADNSYFNETTILALVDELYQKRGIEIFFIDEIHRYANWNQELKNIYDSFPKVKVVFSGSSSIDLVHGSYDLSRRAKLIHMPGLSFREYLNLTTGQNIKAVSFDELIENHQQLAGQLSATTTVLQHFSDYMRFGYYPFVLNDRDHLYSAIANVIDKTVNQDIANFYNLRTNHLNCFKRIINFLASIPPGKINTNNIARHLGIDNKTAQHYLAILIETGMAKALHPVAKGSQLLTRPAKIYLDNSTLQSAVNTFLSTPLNIGTLRELTFLQMLSGAGIAVFHSAIGDFTANNITFEVGGENKTGQQLKAANGRKIVVKDDVVFGAKDEIPLYLFGFLY